MKQPLGNRIKAERSAIVFSAGVGETPFAIRKTKIHIVANIKVQPSIPIKIKKGRTDAPSGIICPGLFGNISESSISVVSPHLVGSKISQVQINPTIVVEVARRHTHAIAMRVNSALVSHICKLQRTATVRMNY